MALSAGSIAFTGINSDDPDALAFVALEDIAAGTVISFTDNNWNGTAFATNEGTITFTAASGIAAGTVVEMEALQSTTPTTSLGSVTRSGAFNIGNSTDAVYAFTGTAAAPTFLAAINEQAFGTTNVLSGTGLTEGVNALALGSVHIGGYVGARSGLASFSAYAGAINTASNWATQVGAGSQAGDGVTPDVPFPTTAFTLAAPQPQPGTLSIAAANVSEGNSGTSDLVFTVSRTGGSDGAVSASWALAFGTADASDLLAGQPTSGTVDFLAGQTSATITLKVAGDTAFEPNETLSLTLSAPTGGAALGTATATGTILNDDAAPPAPAGNVWINELHYDNTGTDTGEAVEIAGAAGTDLSGYKLVFYNGSNTPAAAPVYQTTNLTGTIDDEGSGYGAVSFPYPSNGIQNGVADGVALIAPDGTVIELISYEGTFTAAAGTPAAGITSTDIGVAEEPAPAAGQSLQLKGAGSSISDFSWSAASTASFGSLNTGQSILPANGPAHYRIDDARVTEGDSGTSNLSFVVHRAGGSAGATTIDYTVNLDGTANAADLAPGAVLSGTLTFAAGEFLKTITVPVQGDTASELNETLSVTIANPSGTGTIDDASATGTILNDDPLALTIAQIQGAGHTSAYVGQNVLTTGIVTAVDSNGFYLQMAVGDGDAATSDGVFVFTGTAPTVAVGDAASVRGTVAEFAGDAKALTVTEITAPTVTVTGSGNALPAAVLIGADGVLPPGQHIENDGFASFDPQHDGIDFWESLEGMRVTIQAPQVVSNTNSFGETDVVASHGVGATGLNDRGGITISPNGDGTVDYNPEKIQIDDDAGVFAGFTPGYTIGDQLSDVTGIVNYSFDNYEVVVTSAVMQTKDVTLGREVTTLQSDSNYLSIATYNLENLDPSDNKYALLASDIVLNLGAPDILAVQEVQDADGAGTGTDLSGVSNAQGLIDAMALLGKHYAYVEIAPTTTNTSGGEPNGNIRNGYFYNTDRVSYVTGSAQIITDPAFNNSRKPLVAQFTFAGQTITTIDVHSTSRGGSDPLWGNAQPPADAGDAARTAQAAAVKAYVNEHLATDPSLKIAILGDWNGFYFEAAQTQLTDPAQGGVFTNLNGLLPSEERYSYLFEGNAQQIDNILVTANLLAGAKYDAVHLNSQTDPATRPTDHDPQLALLFLGTAPHDLALSSASVAENSAAGTVVGTLSASDTPNDRLTYALTDDAGGRFAVDPVTGVITTTAPFDYEASQGFNVVGKATDAGGLSTTRTFAIAVTDVEEPGIVLKGGNGNDVINGTNNNDTLNGENGNDTIHGLGGSDTISGGNGTDTLYGDGGNDTILGGAGSDTIYGGEGNDLIIGGKGDDVLFGGAGADTFQFGRGDGIDTIRDFDIALDTIRLDPGVFVQRSAVAYVDQSGNPVAGHDGTPVLIVSLFSGLQVRLVGVDDISQVHFQTVGAPTLAGLGLDVLL